MIGENPLTAANLDIVGALAPTLTLLMTKLFRQLCDRAQSHIQKAKWQQKYYADKKRRAVEYAVGDKLVPHRPRPPHLVPPKADAAWPPIRNTAGNPTEEYEVDYIMDQRGSGADAQYLVKWCAIQALLQCLCTTTGLHLPSGVGPHIVDFIFPCWTACCIADRRPGGVGFHGNQIGRAGAVRN
ncbi:hypothetical protein ETH_00001345 [Eimeria tenella]|uniref:Uncharacterized protein n=1 Tax=Eimeria tenella TaxID=5802 RepID=U6L022_EIMTE|nr:hypothetical protein ETH_00001345 [Eimeria tenella]CDJ41909.1 hypothetical protein ETH_00001345 [Eimeria tenella]|eukprot:XP_013232659.1 hypothetical protein ETH_00001345 [Eimeria tenella]